MPTLAEALHDRYEIERELGRGGMATVYLARDRRHGRPVAVKVLQPEVAAYLGRERFLREIELAAGLTHPHIVPVYDSGDAAGVLYYVMPYVEGESLRERLSREHRLTVAETVRLAREVADALDYAHRRGIVHRDIKPENILLEEGHAVVSDFGVARAVSAAGGERLTHTGSTVGTPMYMSPEQAAGEAHLDGRTDIYSLGCVLFEALTGVPPFNAPTALGILTRRLTEAPPLLRTVDPTIPATVEAALARALSANPADRFASAAGLSAALSSGEGIEPAYHVKGRPFISRNVRPEQASVAVLPFVNLSPDPENEYFSDGMTEELIGALAKVPGIRVASRSACFALKGTDQDVRAIGERLRVRMLVEGSVRKIGKRIRITAQLIDVAAGYHLWSETYDRELADVFAVQDEIARTLASRLKPELGKLEAPPLVDPGTANVEAYTLQLRGMHYSWKRSPETFRIALEYFRQAVKVDPNYARAYASIGHTYTMLGFDDFAVLPPLEAMPQAKAAIAKALELDPLLGHAHTRRAVTTFLFDWDWVSAEQQFEHAASLSPADLTTLHWHSVFLSAMGRHDESFQLVAQALAVDPLSEAMNVRLGSVHYFAGRYDEAAKQLLATVEMEPGSVSNSVLLARVYLRQERHADASALLEGMIGRAGRVPILLAYLGQTYGASGKRNEAIRILDELHSEGQRRYIPLLYQAIIYGAVGEEDELFRLWNLAYEERSTWLPFLRVEPLWDSHRADPRFIALLEKMRLDF